MNNENKAVLKRLIISALVIGAIVGGVYLVFYLLGWTSLTKEQLQEVVGNTGALAPLFYIFISFLQVTFVPIPGAITILSGAYLFGVWEAFIYSYVGMMIGAIFAFFLGRKLGRPFVNWVAGGKEKADGWVERLKGRENVFLFFAFFLPFFPDDILCSVAGILPVKWRTFIIMQIITRATSIGGTMLFMSGEVIPYHGWGLVVLAVIGIICLTAFILSIKYADKLNAFFDKMINAITLKKKK